MTNMPKVYGAPEAEADHVPDEQGMRGERTGPRSSEAGAIREFPGADGAPIAVEETSGIAAAEAASPPDESGDEARRAP